MERKKAITTEGSKSEEMKLEDVKVHTVKKRRV